MAVQIELVGTHKRKPEISDPSEAVDTILAPLRRGEGARHLWLGDTGQGKTVANRLVVDQIVAARLTDVVLTVDEKSPRLAQYSGTIRANPAHLRDMPARTPLEARHIVFRGTAYRRNLGDAVHPLEVSQMGWDLVRLSPVSVLLNLDELADATNGYQAWDGDELAQIYRKGRGVGLSVFATTQLPQLLPREAFGLSETIAIFRLDGRESSYLVKYRVLSPDVAEIIPRLEVGEWVLYRKGQGGWNGKIYKFDL